jgi:hypothetical protein
MKRTVFRIFLLLMLVLALGLILMLALRGGEAEEPTLTSPALTAQLNRLRDGVQPGTAGSSLKAAGAAADLLDWAEDPIPQENIDATVAEWLAAQSAEARQRLPEQRDALHGMVVELTTSYEDAAGLLADAGLTGRGPWSEAAAERVFALLEQLNP